MGGHDERAHLYYLQVNYIFFRREGTENSGAAEDLYFLVMGSRTRECAVPDQLREIRFQTWSVSGIGNACFRKRLAFHKDLCGCIDYIHGKCRTGALSEPHVQIQYRFYSD